jgi:hypothetical protein
MKDIHVNEAELAQEIAQMLVECPPGDELVIHIKPAPWAANGRQSRSIGKMGNNDRLAMDRRDVRLGLPAHFVKGCCILAIVAQMPVAFYPRDLARQCGMSVASTLKTLRRYERKGWLAFTRRSAKWARTKKFPTGDRLAREIERERQRQDNCSTGKTGNKPRSIFFNSSRVS